MSSKVDFTTMKKWVPDYANKASANLWSGANLTATIAETGFVTYCVNAYAFNTTQSVRVLIDNVVIAKDDTEARSPNNSVLAAVSGVAPVCAGDTITAFKNSGSFNIIECYFIPGKWV